MLGIRNFLLLFCLLAAFSIAAQERLYLKPSTGIGFSGARTQQANTSFTKQTILGIGYQKNKWRAETGIGYQRATTLAGNPNFFDTAKMQKFYYSIVIPFRLSYQLRINNSNFSLNPALGVALSYNTHPGAGNKATDIIKVQTPFTPFSMLGEAQLNGTYKLNKHVDLFGGPAFQYMLTPIGNHAGPSISEYRQQHYNWMVNAGINWYLPRNKTSIDTPHH
jgi:hypothetical protein